MTTDLPFNEDYFIPLSSGDTTQPAVILDREKLIHDSMVMQDFNILGKNNEIRKFIIPISKLKESDMGKFKLWFNKLKNKI